MRYDLVVIGSGPAGEKGAAQAAWFGRRVALVEREPVLGGACVNTGTIPSKTLRESAVHLSGFRQRELYGIDLSVRHDITINDLMHRERQVVEGEWARIEENLRRHSIERIRGDATFQSPHQVIIRNAGSERIVEAGVFLIATGSSPYHPPEIEFDHRRILDSDSILRLDRIPETLAVMGAGVVGCEYASIFAALGVRVTLIDGRKALLPHVDRELVDLLLESFRQRLQMEIQIGHEVSSVEPAGERVRLVLDDGRSLEVDNVLVAAGRQSNTLALGLESAGVTLGRRGLIPVNEKYQTNVPHIYAAGDVIGFPALASTSMEQARVAMVHAFDLKYKTRVAPILPFGIYTIPELSMAGLTEDECTERDIPFEIGRAWYRDNPRGQIIGDTEGLLKLVFDPETLRLLGIHIVGENASELLHVGMIVMQFDGTINAFIDGVFNFPTLGDAYKYAAYDGLGNVARRKR